MATFPTCLPRFCAPIATRKLLTSSGPISLILSLATSYLVYLKSAVLHLLVSTFSSYLVTDADPSNQMVPLHLQSPSQLPQPQLRRSLQQQTVMMRSPFLAPLVASLLHPSSPSRPDLPSLPDLIQDCRFALYRILIFNCLFSTTDNVYH